MTSDVESVRAGSKRIEEGLREYNIAVIGDGSYLPLRIFAREESGEVIGGLLGGSYWSWLSIDELWVTKEHRQQGHATTLMGMAEEEARRRGCCAAYLDTYSFQARPLYERLGYRVVGTIAKLPPGHERYYLVKELEPTRP